MKNLLLLLSISFLVGCTVSANNHHFKLDDYISKSYDDVENTWCFVAVSVSDIVMCSSPYERHSKSIGFILPIIPQVNRDSRLAYDITRSRKVQFKNQSLTQSAIFTLPVDSQICPDEYSTNCQVVESIKIPHSSSIWVKVPSGSEHIIGIAAGSNRFKVVLKEFIDSRWHLVRV